MPSLRTFIAVETPEELKIRIHEIQEALKREGGDVKWVRPEGVHLTLKFLGDVEAGRIPDVAGAVEQAAKTFKPFRVGTSGAGFFPGPGRPRVIWIGIGEGSESLVRLAGEVDTRLSSLGFDREKRAFSPHLTIGRVRSPGGIGGTVRRMESMTIPATGFTADRIVVMKSELQRTGAVYTPLHIIKLEV